MKLKFVARFREVNLAEMRRVVQSVLRKPDQVIEQIDLNLLDFPDDFSVEENSH